MNQGEVASLVAIAGLVLSTLGVTGVDSTMLNAAINGIISIVAIGAAIWSWSQHRKTA